MSRWLVEAFEIEIESNSWTTDSDGDRVGYRSGTGSIFIPAGVALKRLDRKGGLFTERGTSPTDFDFEVHRWSSEDILDYERDNGEGSFDDNYVRVSVDFLEH